MPELEIRDDPSLSPEEKEVMVRFSRADDHLTIHAEQGTVIKWLLGHPDFTPTNRRVRNGTLHAISGTLPVGALKLSGKPRQSNQTSHILGELPEEEP